MVVQYKCSNCGADMAFDTESGMLHCDSCGNNEEINSSSHTDDDPSYDSDNEYDDNFEFGSTEVNDEEANEYQCNNCGLSY